MRIKENNMWSMDELSMSMLMLTLIEKLGLP